MVLLVTYTQCDFSSSAAPWNMLVSSWASWEKISANKSQIQVLQHNFAQSGVFHDTWKDGTYICGWQSAGFEISDSASDSDFFQLQQIMFDLFRCFKICTGYTRDWLFIYLANHSYHIWSHCSCTDWYHVLLCTLPSPNNYMDAWKESYRESDCPGHLQRKA